MSGPLNVSRKADISLIQASACHPGVEKTQPLGLMYIASYLVANGIRPRLTDMKVHDLRVGDVLAEYRADPTPVVGIGCITLDSTAAHELARGIKRINSEALVVMGGAHATAYWDDVLQDDAVDAVVLQEGERTLLDILRAMTDGRDRFDVPGIACRGPDGLRLSADREAVDDLDALPFPAWNLIPVEKYWRRPRIGWIYSEREYMCVVTSRGCPYRCRYCHHTLGKTWRARSVDNIARELRLLKEEYGIREIVVVDDTFNLSEKRTREFARRLIEDRLGLKLHFPVGFRGDILTTETAALLKDAGMYRCMIAVETGSERIQKLIDKNLDMAKVSRIVNEIVKMGVLTHGVFMLGFPTETREEMERTMRFALESKFHTMAISIAIPFKNSGLVKLAEADGIVFEDKFDRYSFTRSDVNLSRVPIEWIKSLRREMYRRFFSPVRLWRFLRLLPHPFTHLWTLANVFVRKAFLW